MKGHKRKNATNATNEERSSADLWHFSYRLGGGKGEVPGAGLGVVPGLAGVAPGGGVAVGPGVSPGGVRAGVGVGDGPDSSSPAGRLPARPKGTVWSTRPAAVRRASRRMAQRACLLGGMLMRVRLRVAGLKARWPRLKKPALLFAWDAALWYGLYPFCCTRLERL